MANFYKPGQDNKSSGKYIEIGPRGGKVNHGNHATIDTGDRLPPTKSKNDL